MKWRLAVPVVLGAVVLTSQGAPLARAVIITPYSPSAATTLAPGVRHERGVVGVGKDLQQNVNVVELDRSEPSTSLRLSQADGVATSRKLVTDQALDFSAEGRHVVATVNGSTFFYLPDPSDPPDPLHALGATGQGLNVSDGELINAGAPVSSAQIMAFGVDGEGQPLLGYPQLDMKLALPEAAEIDLSRVNQRRLVNDIVLFTPRFDTHTWTDDLGDEYVIEGFDLPLTTTGVHTGNVVAVHEGTGDNPIGPGQVVLSVADGAAATVGTLSVGDVVSLTVSIDEPWQHVENSVGGRNMLVVDGANVTSTGGLRFARTMVGIKPQGDLILVTADGGYTDSGGLSLYESAQLMISLGAVDAVNLDGGSSTQMAVRDPGADSLHMVNALNSSPEDYRPVSNALQIVASSSISPDLSAPVVEEPAFALAPVSRAAKSQALLDVTWTATDESAIHSIEVETQIGAASWQSLPSVTAAATSIPLQLPYGRPARVRVRAADAWGNTSDWVTSQRVRVMLVDESDARVVRSGGWRRRADSRSFGGAYRRSKTTSARAELAISGHQVALIGRVGPRGGPASLVIDAGPAIVIETFSATTDYRRMLFLGPATPSAAQHVLAVRNAGTVDRPLVEIDAFLVLETAT